MRLLLDTHAFLWWQTNDPRLSVKASTAIAERANEVFVSAATAWELAVKQAKGQILLPGPLAPAIEASGFSALAIDIPAAERACTLPWHHRDPWDRLLLAQALQHGLTLVSCDEALPAYGVPLLW